MTTSEAIEQLKALRRIVQIHILGEIDRIIKELKDEECATDIPTSLL